jgi:hypothetical protein
MYLSSFQVDEELRKEIVKTIAYFIMLTAAT